MSIIINPEIKVFSTNCAICGTPLSGLNLYQRGELYYCASDFQRTSPEELAENAKLAQERLAFERIFKVKS